MQNIKIRTKLSSWRLGSGYYFWKCSDPDSGFWVRMIQICNSGYGYGRSYGRFYGRFYGQFYGRSYRRSYGRFYGRSFGRFYGRFYGKFYGRPYDGLTDIAVYTKAALVKKIKPKVWTLFVARSSTSFLWTLIYRHCCVVINIGRNKEQGILFIL